MHPAIIIATVRSLIVDVAMGQIPRSTERISSYRNSSFIVDVDIGQILRPTEHISSYLYLQKTDCMLQIQCNVQAAQLHNATDT